MNETPRYTASMPLQETFLTNADASGDHVFTQVKREDNVCLYSRTSVETGKVVGFEVFQVKVVPAGTVFVKGGKPTENDYESYPGKTSFGRTAWFFPSLESAEVKFNEVLQKKESVSVPSAPSPVSTTKVQVVVAKVEKGVVNFKIPKKEFTQADFAEKNGLPLRGTVYNHIQSLVKSGVIKESRRVQFGKGRPTVLYVKV